MKTYLFWRGFLFGLVVAFLLLGTFFLGLGLIATSNRQLLEGFAIGCLGLACFPISIGLMLNDRATKP